MERNRQASLPSHGQPPRYHNGRRIQKKIVSQKIGKKKPKKNTRFQTGGSNPVSFRRPQNTARAERQSRKGDGEWNLMTPGARRTRRHRVTGSSRHRVQKGRATGRAEKLKAEGQKLKAEKLKETGQTNPTKQTNPNRRRKA